MNKNLNKSAYSLFARSKYDYAQEVQDLHCAFLCDLSTRAKTIILSLVIAITVLATTGMAGMNVYAETGTVRVATFDQLRVALEDTQGVKKIVVDPQAAADDGDVIYSVENDEDNDAFYIGFDAPLTVSHDITITSADDVDVFFARSDSFRRDQGNPALFNIDRTGNLKLEGLITMTGEEVTTAYNDREFVFSIKSRDGTGDDNDAWNRGQVLKGGFYIQNNGGEYNLGEDVILEDFHTTDDVEGVEPIHEKETNSLFGAKKSDEEATEEKEEETVVAPAPKRMMKKALMGTTPTRSGDTSSSIVVENGVTTVSTSRQLKEALATPGVTTIYIDPTGAFSEVPYTDKDGNKTVEIEQTDSNPDKTFYLPVDEPLTIAKGDEDRSVTIRTKGGKKAIITRSEQFTNITGNRAAIFNVPSGVTLTLDSNITMSGDKVTSTYKYKGSNDSGYNPGVGYASFDEGVLQLQAVENTYFGVVISTGFGNIEHLNFGLVSSDKAQPLYVNSSGFILIDYQKTGENEPKTYKINTSKELIDQTTGAPSGSDLKLRELKADGTLADVSKLRKDATYVISTYNSYTSTEKFLKSDLNFSDAGATSQAMKFKAASSVEDFNNVETTYEPVKFSFDVAKHEWSQADAPSGTQDNPKGFFVQVESGGKLKITGAILKDYKTVKTYTKGGAAASNSPVWTAPVVVMGKFEMTAGNITANRVGYCADDTKSDGDAQAIKKYMLDTELMNTAGGVIFKGSSADGKLKGSALIQRNKGDAGGVIVTDGAKLTIEGALDGSSGAGIDGNLGWHHAGAALVDDNGTIHMKGGHMVNNTTWNRGGAVWATEWGTNGLVRKAGGGVVTNPDTKKKPGGNFVMDAGKLGGNMAFLRGGAINVESDGVQLKGGYITNNYCKSLGGAIYVEGDSAEYTYTLVIKEGNISSNKAVSGGNATLAKKIDSSKDAPSEIRAEGTQRANWDGDFPNVHNGNGGGVWLCPLGGTSVFAFNKSDDTKVVIDGNTGAKAGDDFYICRGKGSALVQGLVGSWYKDNNGARDSNNKVNITDGTILNGILGMVNKGSDTQTEGVQITGNISRDGGGIASNGTLILGEAKDVHRYRAKFDIEKLWDGVTPDSDGIELELWYVDGSHEEKILTKKLNGVKDTEDSAETFEFGESEGEVIVVSEQQPAENRWSAEVELPPYFITSAGQRVPLYLVQDPDNSSKTLDLINNTNDIKKLYDAIKANKTITIAPNSWKIEIREKGNKYSFDNSGSISITEKVNFVAEEIRLKNPVNGEPVQGGQFDIIFSTLKFKQTVKNSNLAYDENLTKTDGTNAIVGKSAQFKLYEAVKNKPNEPKWYNWVPQGNGTVVNLNTNNGKLELTGLKGGATYMLFETQAPAGFKRQVDPWFLFVNANTGAVTVKVMDNNHKGHYWLDDGTNDKGMSGFTGDYTSELQYKEWPDTWLANNSGGTNISNELTSITLSKVDSSTLNKITQGKAKFALYETNRTVEEVFPNGTPNETNKDICVKKQNDAVAPAVYGDGANDAHGLLETVNGELNIQGLEPNKLYLMFEAEAPAGYQRSRTPWLIWVKEDGSFQVFKYNAGKFKAGGPKKDVDDPSHIGWDKQKQTLDARGFPTKHDMTKDGAVDLPTGQFNYIPVEPSNGEIKLTNRAIPLEIVKVDSQSNTTPLQGVEFDLYRGTVREETDSSTGEKHYVYSVASGNPKVNTSKLVTNAEGKITLPTLEAAAANNPVGYNLYLLFETKAKPGYKIPVAPWGIRVGRDGDVELYRLKKVGDASYSADRIAHYNDTYTASKDNPALNIQLDCRDLVDNGSNKIGNDYKPLELSKKKGMLNSATNSLSTTDVIVSGAQFEIFEATESGDYILKGNSIGTMSSDTNGKIELPRAVSVATGKKYYWIEETSAPAGYVKAEQPWLIIVDDDTNAGERYIQKVMRTDVGENQSILEAGKWRKDKWIPTFSTTSANGNPDAEPTLYNQPVSIYKTNESGEAFLPNASFKVYRTTLQNGYYNVTSSMYLGDVESLEGGIIDLSQIVSTSIGTANKLDMLVYETSQPHGYKKATAPWLVTVNRDGTVTVKQWYSRYTDKGLPGTSTQTWYKDNFKVNMPNKNLINEPKDLVFTKVNSITGYGLKGAKFEIWECGSIEYNYQTGAYDYIIATKLYDTVTSDEHGVVTIPIKNIYQEKYFLIYETEAPEGHILNPIPYYVIVKNGSVTTFAHNSHPENYSNVTATTPKTSVKWLWEDYGCDENNPVVENTKMYDLPSAGGMGTYWFMVIGMGMMTFAVTTLISRKFSKKKL